MMKNVEHQDASPALVAQSWLVFQVGSSSRLNELRAPRNVVDDMTHLQN